MNVISKITLSTVRYYTKGKYLCPSTILSSNYTLVYIARQIDRQADMQAKLLTLNKAIPRDIKVNAASCLERKNVKCPGSTYWVPYTNDVVVFPVTGINCSTRARSKRKAREAEIQFYLLAFRSQPRICAWG